MTGAAARHIRDDANDQEWTASFPMGIATPCNSVCTLDPRSGFCLGCGRTGEEIACWLSFPEELRLQLMQELPDRLAALSSQGAPSAKAAARRKNRRPGDAT